MITLTDYYMKRDVQHRHELTREIEAAAQVTVERARKLLERALPDGVPYRGVSSGWRPPSVNSAAGGATRSKHLLGQAVDLVDPDGALDKWCLAHLDVLEAIGLWLEHPGWTDGWCHVQSAPPRDPSHRVYIPYPGEPAVTIYGKLPFIRRAA